MRSLILRSFLSNGIWGCDWSWFLIISHALSIVLTVQNWRGLPTLRWSVSLGMADLVAKVDWWRGCCLSLLKMCPNSLSFLSWRISVSGLILFILLSACPPMISFALRKTYSLEFLRCTKVVCSFRIFLSPLSWKVSNSRPAVSVGSIVSKP